MKTQKLKSFSTINNVSIERKPGRGGEVWYYQTTITGHSWKHQRMTAKRKTYDLEMALQFIEGTRQNSCCSI